MRNIDTMSSINQICLINGEKTVVAAQENGLVSFLPMKFLKSQEESPWKATSSHNSPICCICFVKNEKYFITGSFNGMVDIQPTKQLKSLYEIKAHSNKIVKIEVSPCGKYFVTASYDSTVIIWNFKTRSIIKKLKFDQSVLSLHYFTKSNFLVILCFDTIQLHDLGTSQTNLVLKIKASDVISISSDLRCMAYGNSVLNLFDLEINRQVSKTNTLEESISCIVFTKKCKSVAVGFYNGEIIIFSIPDLIKVRRIDFRINYLNCIDISASKVYIAGSDCEAIMIILRIDTNKVIYELQDAKVLSLRFSKNSENFIYSVKNSIFILNKNLIKIAMISFSHFIDQILLSECESNFILSQSKQRYSIFNLKTFKKLFEDEETKVMKKWCEQQQDLKCGVYLSMRKMVRLDLVANKIVLSFILQ